MSRLLFIVLLLTAGKLQADLNVMTINTEWLWTPHDQQIDGSRYNKGDMAPKQYAEEIQFYADLVKSNSVQILAVSEIENQIVANDLAKSFGLGWRAYFKQGRDTATGQDVAILSNLEPVKSTLTDFGFPRGQLPNTSGKKKRLSKVVGIQFWSNSGSDKKKIGVITSHFLSKRKESKKKILNRKRQAYALIKAIDEFIAEVDSLIVLGDFNDYIYSDTLTILMKKHQLLSAELTINEANNAQLSKKTLTRIDHILYHNLQVQDFDTINLNQYSDHAAVFSRFF